MKIKSYFPGQRFCRFTDLPKGRVLGESSASDRLLERCEKKCCKLTEISDDTRFNFFLIFQTNLCVLLKFIFSDMEFECNTGRLDVATFDFSPTFKCPLFFPSSVFRFRTCFELWQTALRCGLDSLTPCKWSWLVFQRVCNQLTFLFFFLFERFREAAPTREIKAWKWIIQPEWALLHAP